MVSAPSGTGKTTVVEALTKKMNRFERVITHTTRRPRPAEKDGEDYFFVGHEEFSEMIMGKEFVEWAVVYNEKYGTSKKQIKSILNKRKNAILVIEEQGAQEVRKIFPDESVFILLLPPDMKELERRIKTRPGMRREDVEYRLKLATQEINSMKWYDYVIVNKDVRKTVSELSKIIDCERLKLSRNQQVLSKFS